VKSKKKGAEYGKRDRSRKITHQERTTSESEKPTAKWLEASACQVQNEVEALKRQERREDAHPKRLLARLLNSGGLKGVRNVRRGTGVTEGGPQ